MNINQNINKLLYALKVKGQLYKINTFKSYNEKNDKYTTSYKILKLKQVKEYNQKTDEVELVEKYKEDYNCYSKIDLMKYLAEEYRKGSEADGR